MNGIEIKDALYIGGIILSAVITFLTTRHNIKKLIRDKNDETKKQLHNLEIEIEKLKVKDGLQKQIIDQFQKQVLDHLPRLFQIIENNKSNVEK